MLNRTNMEYIFEFNDLIFFEFVTNFDLFYKQSVRYE
jgi:hypothetical protein